MGRLRVLEAMTALCAAQVLLRVVPFSRLRALTGTASGSAAADRPARRSPVARARTVGGALRRGAHRLPWHSSCLVRALAGRMMLARRRLPSTLVVGVSTDRRGLRAHAWLLCGDGMVCGGREAPEFHPLASFRSATGPDPGPR